jgi:hypothetical protein
MDTEKKPRLLIVCRGEPGSLSAENVAEFYGVTTEDIMQAVKDNPEKLPQGFFYEYTEEEKIKFIKENDDPKNRYTFVFQTTFFKQGIYMLATVLKSKIAVEKTIEMIKTIVKAQEMTQDANNMFDKLMPK